MVASLSGSALGSEQGLPSAFVILLPPPPLISPIFTLTNCPSAVSWLLPWIKLSERYCQVGTDRRKMCSVLFGNLQSMEETHVNEALCHFENNAVLLRTMPWGWLSG